MARWIKQKWFPLTIGLLLATRLLHFEPWMDTYYGQRQADAAQYALDFYQHGIDLFNPAVCWLGDHKTLILEFPLHEAMTALLYHAFGFNHIWARVVTFGFFLLAVIYFYRMLLHLTDRVLARVATITYLVLPLGLVFSRSVHADFAAIGLAHMAVFYVLKAIDDRPAVPTLLLFTIAATLSALIKIPYLFYFALPLGMYLLQRWNTRTVLCLVPAAVIPAVLFVLWRNHVFAINDQAPDWKWIPGYYKFTHMGSWYFGALSMRFDLGNWWILLKRLALDIATPMGLVFLLFGLLQKTRARLFLLAWLGGSLLYVLVFFRLNVIHSYYQNPLLSIAAVFIAMGIIAALKDRRTLIPVALLAVALPAYGWAERSYFHRNTYAEEIGKRVQEHSAQEDLVVIAYPSTDWCDPRMLYAARRNGWALRTTQLTAENLRAYRSAGAKVLVIFKPDDLGADVVKALEAQTPAVYDVRWDKQALHIYSYE